LVELINFLPFFIVNEKPFFRAAENKFAFH